MDLINWYINFDQYIEKPKEKLIKNSEDFYFIGNNKILSEWIEETIDHPTNEQIGFFEGLWENPKS